VCSSDHSLRSAAHAYHYFSPCGSLSGALCSGCNGRPGPFGPANSKWGITLIGYSSNCENLTGWSFPLSATLIYSPSGSSAPYPSANLSDFYENLTGCNLPLS
jgi:hypothetical protein